MRNKRAVKLRVLRRIEILKSQFNSLASKFLGVNIALTACGLIKLIRLQVLANSDKLFVLPLWQIQFQISRKSDFCGDF
jgi:hypothetical protein